MSRPRDPTGLHAEATWGARVPVRDGRPGSRRPCPRVAEATSPHSGPGEARCPGAVLGGPGAGSGVGQLSSLARHWGHEPRARTAAGGALGARRGGAAPRGPASPPQSPSDGGERGRGRFLPQSPRSLVTHSRRRPPPRGGAPGNPSQSPPPAPLPFQNTGSLPVGVRGALLVLTAGLGPAGSALRPVRRSGLGQQRGPGPRRPARGAGPFWVPEASGCPGPGQALPSRLPPSRRCLLPTPETPLRTVWAPTHVPECGTGLLVTPSQFHHQSGTQFGTSS